MHFWIGAGIIYTFLMLIVLSLCKAAKKGEEHDDEGNIKQ